MADSVECRSDAAYAQRPLALTWAGTRQEIVEIRSEWRSPAGKHFRIRTAAGNEFELFYSEATDEWQITLL